MRKINKIILHCSASSFGDRAIIDKWHKDNGWSGIGYHYVINNGIAKARSKYDEARDGIIEEGRPEEQVGSHCQGENKDSIGICLIGDKNFTEKQFTSLARLLNVLMNKYNLTQDKIFGHNFFNKNKACPVFIVEVFKKKYLKKE